LGPDAPQFHLVEQQQKRGGVSDNKINQVSAAAAIEDVPQK
jgi:hypothetical protein